MKRAQLPLVLATTVLQTAHSWWLPTARVIPFRCSKERKVSQHLIRGRLISFPAVQNRLFSSTWNDEEYQSSDQMAWKTCQKCRGEGRIRRPPSKKARLKQRQMQEQKQRENEHDSKRIKLHDSLPPRYEPCKFCNQTGILESTELPKVLDCYPSIAIVGGGLGGLALGIACSHRGIPFQVFERDTSFLMRCVGV